ncbi:non-ribosomal peptide synthetase [Streptomyces sp. NPDC054794]
MTTAIPRRRPATSSVTDAYPLSRLQAGMIYHAELEGDASYYHDIYSLRVHGPWQEDAFRAAVDGLVAAHEVLRTSFELAKFSEPLQLVHSAVEAPVEVVDLRGVEDWTAVLDAWRHAETQRPFDFAQAPLFRMVVHLLDDGQFHFWWSFHHAMMDGWSLHSAVTELFAGYTAIRQGRAPQFTTPRTRYRDYIALELDALDDPRQRDFWRGRLAGAEPATLPTPPRRTTAELDSTVEVEWHDIPAPVLASLTELATRLRVPVRTVLLTAHLRVVSALLGRSDVITGVVGNGRPETTDAEQVKGLFLSTYPLRTRIPEASWADFATAVFAEETAILPNRRYPLAAMVEETGWSPFDLVFDFRRFRSYEGLAEQDDTHFDLGAYYEHTNFPLTSGFVMNPDGTELRLQFRYDARRFDTDDTARIARAYLSVLARIASDPEEPVLTEPALAPEDVAALTRHATGPWQEADGPRGAYQRIERAAARAGHDTAVRAVDGEQNYLELLEAAGRIAGYLQDAGVRRGDPVGVCMNRTALLVPTLLAIWRIGANYVSLDPSYPLDRLRYIASHSGAGFVLHDAASASVASELEPAALPVETAATHGRSADPVEVTGDELAYTIYTSGSTGLPKGVQVPHGAVVNFLDALIDRLSLDKDHTFLATTSISFDIHVNEMYVPLVLGAPMVLAARSQVSDGAALRDLIEAEPDLVAQGPPALWRMLLDAGWRPHGMAAVLCGGEAFPRDLAEKLTRDGVPVWNMYGPTETTVWSAVGRVDGGDATVPIGRPVRNTTLWVLDEHMHPVFPGVPGELYIGGDGVVRAYHDRPDLTADRFVPDPFAGAGRPGARLYRTGDLVRTADDGTFEYLERVDLQVKVRGYRIELEEVEARLGAHPDVSAAVVAAPLGSDGERVLAGYAVAAPGVDGTALRAWCAEALPDYMVPQAWVLLDALPLTPNGKVDRKSLPGVGEAVTATADSTAPASETERAVAAIWSEVLGITGTGVHANFFDLGGHSLRALRVVLKIRDELGVDVPVATLLQASTIRRLAAVIDRQTGGGAEADRPLLVPLNSTGATPLFLFHPLGGHIFGYGPLGRNLDGEVSVYGIRAKGMEPGEEPTDSMAALVDRYLTEIRAVQPEGPYRLAGWCMGATVAVETARRLRAEGAEVAYLGLIVANPFDQAPGILLHDETALVHHMLGQGTDVTYEELAALSGLDEQIERVFSRSRESGQLRDDVTSLADAHRLLAVYQANAKAITAREPAPYDGAAQVFVLPADGFQPADMGWSKVITGAVTLQELPGLPTDFLDPENVSRLADILAEELNGTAHA